MLMSLPNRLLTSLLIGNVLYCGVAFAGGLKELTTGSSIDGQYKKQFEIIYNKFGGLPKSVVNKPDTSIFFALWGDGSGITKYELDDSPKILSSWPLARWENEYIEPKVTARYNRVGIDYPGLRILDDAPGCLSNSPLHYGDVEDDGSKELVVFLGSDLVFFSPSKGRIKFMTQWMVDDWMGIDSTERWYEENSPPGKVRPEDPQYQSAIAAAAVGNHQGQRFPGYRGYSKVYVGDFDSDSSSDILVWRKLYESRLRNDSKSGFKHLKDTFLHYSNTENGYQRTETDQSTIESWLQEQGLKWMDGFPSRSECEGEKGQLIPEMHDPLLNDPEVLP